MINLMKTDNDKLAVIKQKINPWATKKEGDFLPLMAWGRIDSRGGFPLMFSRVALAETGWPF